MKTYTFNDMMDVIRMLAHSQGFYGRLLRDFEEAYQTDEDEFWEFAHYLEEQKFTSDLDVILFFET